MRYILSRNEKLRNNHLHFFLFEEKMLTNRTLLLMLDTSMYTTAASKYLECYSAFLRQPIESQQSLIDVQNKFIISKIRKYKDEISHLILIGHHPIIGIKNKSKSPKAEKTKSKEEDPLLNDIPHFTETLNTIYGILSSQVTYTYLCADLHLYQKGKIVMPTTMEINQYIVGTGGTELDDPIPVEMIKDRKHTRVSDGTQYEIDECRQEFGFLECVIDDDVTGPVFRFISADVKKGGTLPKMTRKRRIKNNKIKLVKNV